MLSKSLAGKILLCILILGFIFRLYRINNPIADWHSWRQADTASVSRNFVTSGFDILHPRFDDLSNVPSGVDNPEGFRFVEFPIYNILQAGFYKVIGVLTLEEWGRLVSIVVSLFGSYFLYKLVSKYSGEVAGVATAFFYTFLPFNIYYSRTILPDPAMAATIIIGLYFFDKWLDSKTKNWLYFFLSVLFTMISILLKPYALFYGLAFLILIYNSYGLAFFKQWKLWIFGFIAIIPFVGWRLWMGQFPAGIPANAWLLNGNGIRFRPSFFRWIGYERITKLISGYLGVIIMLFGLYQLRLEKAKFLYLSLVAGIVAYICVFATGNVQHDYYQIVIMPVVAILYGLGSKFFLENKKKKLVTIKSILFLSITIIGISMSWWQVKDYFNVNNRAIVIAGMAVDQMTPKDALVIANYNGDTSFLYQTNRKGWASFERSVPEMIQMGADFLVLANPKPADQYFAKDYKIVKQTKDYILFDLRQKP
jgi:4-amino-4-deoxy-L-arabinose transferase-like glycosyltransferase